MNKLIFSKEAQKRIQFLKGAGSMFIVGAVFFASYSIFTSNINESKARESLAKQKLQNITVYIAKNELQQGTVIQKGDFIRTEYPAKYVVKGALTTDGTGEVLRIDTNSKTQLTSSMITDNNNVVTNDLRKQDYSCFTLNKNLTKGAYVDIRLKKKDGSDYVVASKKQVIDLNGSTMITEINENERDYINNAIVYASLTGATLYTTIYVDPVNQNAAPITYQPSTDIKNMISSNPNVVKDAQSNLQSQNTQNQSSDNSSKPSFDGSGN
jgi:hypothetical protein